MKIYKYKLKKLKYLVVLIEKQICTFLEYQKILFFTDIKLKLVLIIYFIKIKLN